MKKKKRKRNITKVIQCHHITYNEKDNLTVLLRQSEHYMITKLNRLPNTTKGFIIALIKWIKKMTKNKLILEGYKIVSTKYLKLLLKRGADYTGTKLYKILLKESNRRDTII